MKISSPAQKLTQEELKRDELKKQETKQAQATQKEISKSKIGQGADTSEISNNPIAQNIKQINSDIGRLQIAQKSLSSIEPDVKKMLKLSKDYKESFDKSEQDEIKEEMSALKKNIESTLKSATFEGSNVFTKNIKDNKDQVIFDAQKLDVKLLNTDDTQKFYDVLKEQQKQIKDAIQTLQGQAQGNTDKLVSSKIKGKDNQNVQSTDGSFLKKFGSLFRVSHNEDKLSTQRVQELLA